MRSIAELNALREKSRENMTIREGCHDSIRVVVAMGDCGIAAGARTVLKAFMKELESHHLNQVAVLQTDCMGDCRSEPLVQVQIPGQQPVTYGNVTPEKAARIVTDHLINGDPVTAYAIADPMK